MLEDLKNERRKKLEALKAKGVNPYPARVKRGMAIAEARGKFAALAKSGKPVFLVGRITGMRDQGKVVFLDLKDESGSIQVVAKKDTLKNFDVLKAALDIGDFISVGGPLFKTQKGEESIEARSMEMAAKSLRPLPGAWQGLEDIETRLRKRYLDILANPDTKEIFKKKAIFWQTTRECLLREGFLEVETPILEAVPGGAEAEPFVTHHNALNTDFYLRISPELHLKRLLVAGFEKIFEIGRIFRNEGIDAEHLQDYTQMEMYWAYQDYRGLMSFLEKMIKKVIKATFGTYAIAHKGQKIDWGKKWKIYDYYGLFKKETGLDLHIATKEDLLKKARVLAIEHADAALGRGRLIDLIYKKTVRLKLIEPGFLVDPPVDVEPLAKRFANDSDRVERFQIVAYGTELGKGFSELNDSIDQRARFEDQMKLRAAGDTEAQMMDEEYVEAMEYGMPPAAGFAYSERLFAVLMDKPVRETVIFPLMRQKTKNNELRIKQTEP